MSRVLAVQIKSEGRIDNANAQQLRPDQIDGGPSKLGVLCQYAGKSLPPWLSESGAPWLSLRAEFHLFLSWQK